MSSSQNQMVSVKEAPKKVSAKEKFAAAQAAKMAKKAEEEKASTAKDSVLAAEKAKHDAVFAKEKKKVAKELTARNAFVEEFKAHILTLTKDERVAKLIELRQMIADVNRSISKTRMELNADATLVGKEAQKLENLNTMVGILSGHV